MFKPAQFSVPEGDTNPLHGKAMTNLTSSEDFMPLFNEPRFEASNKCRARETLFRCTKKCCAWTNVQQFCKCSLIWYPARAKWFPLKPAVSDYTRCHEKVRLTVKAPLLRPWNSQTMSQHKPITKESKHWQFVQRSLECMALSDSYHTKCTVPVPELPVHGLPVLEEVLLCKRGFLLYCIQVTIYQIFKLSCTNAWKLQWQELFAWQTIHRGCDMFRETS